ELTLGLKDKVWIGNLEAERDWGHAKDYVEAMWLMLQQNQPEDYVIATGVKTKVRDIVRMAFNHAGIEIECKGVGKEEKAFVSGVKDDSIKVKKGDVVLEI